MNITEALNVALPEIPAHSLAQRYPRVDPDATFKEHVEDGETVVRVYTPSSQLMYKFPLRNWKLIQLFDGKRTYAEIAELYSRQMGVEYSEEEVRSYAADLEAGEFWYKTPQEKNILLMQQGGEERQKRLKAKSRYGDLSLILFPAFNPDRFLTWFYRYTSFVYTPWFTLLTLAAFALATGISITHWSEIGRDTLEFYTFTDKTWWDLVQFYLLSVVILGFHEFGHAHACKHYGARVPAMGFALIYLTPAFYTDTTEGAVKGTRYQRLVISLAGVWAELMIYAVATPIWWGTPPDTPIHNAAYIGMLITGITSALINWNPLIKLDGYHMLCEIIGIVDLKEASTGYVMAWIKRNVWGLPVEVPYVPKRRRLGYAVYSVCSGLYSYLILFIVARFVGNVFRNFNPDWSFVPELAVAALIFRSRIRKLVNFMKLVYLDKKDRVRSWFTPRRAVLCAGGVSLLFLLPLRHDSISGQFVLEPIHRAVVRAIVPGVVTKTYGEEGQQVVAGTLLLELRNLPLESKLASSQMNYEVASDRATSSSLHYADFGAALLQRDQLAQQSRDLTSEAANLQVKSPLTGTILTPRLEDRVGSYVPEGAELAEVADLSQLRARIYVPEHDVYKLRVGLPARLQVEGALETRDAQVLAIAPVPTPMDPALTGHTQYKGMLPPNFYLAELVVANPGGELKPGMSGMARIYGPRRSLATYLSLETLKFFARKIW